MDPSHSSDIPKNPSSLCGTEFFSPNSSPRNNSLLGEVEWIFCLTWAKEGGNLATRKRFIWVS